MTSSESRALNHAVPSAEAGIITDIEVFRRQVQMTNQTLFANVDGLTNEDSLIQPDPAGNCLNWVVGHLVQVHNELLPLLDEERVLDETRLARYARGSEPLRDPGEAIPFRELLAMWSQVSDGVLEGLGNLTPDSLDRPLPPLPGIGEEETLRSTLSFISFHQAYHVGQTGLLRRIVGREGAIS